MEKEKQKFYGNSLIGTWRVPSTGKRIIPQLADGKQRMIWSNGGFWDELGQYIAEDVDEIEWFEDEGIKNHLMPWYRGEKLEYNEAM
jgi:hypothetical protein